MSWAYVRNSLQWSRNYDYFDKDGTLKQVSLNIFQRVVRRFGGYSDTHLNKLKQMAYAILFRPNGDWKCDADTKKRVLKVIAKYQRNWWGSDRTYNHSLGTIVHAQLAGRILYNPHSDTFSYAFRLKDDFVESQFGIYYRTDGRCRVDVYKGNTLSEGGFNVGPLLNALSSMQIMTPKPEPFRFPFSIDENVKKEARGGFKEIIECNEREWDIKASQEWLGPVVHEPISLHFLKDMPRLQQ